MDNHTPTPWKRGIGNDSDTIYGPDQRKIAEQILNRNDGTIIVHAVNNYKILLTALREAACYGKQKRLMEPFMLEYIQKAIDRAEKETI